MWLKRRVVGCQGLVWLSFRHSFFLLMLLNYLSFIKKSLLLFYLFSMEAGLFIYFKSPFLQFLQIYWTFCLYMRFWLFVSKHRSVLTLILHPYFLNCNGRFSSTALAVWESKVCTEEWEIALELVFIICWVVSVGLSLCSSLAKTCILYFLLSYLLYFRRMWDIWIYSFITNLSTYNLYVVGFIFK